jgi:phosphoglycerate dehydrogenase-like enzyme
MRIAVCPTFAGVDIPGFCADLDGVTFLTDRDPAAMADLAASADMMVVNSPGYTELLANRICRPDSRLRFIQFVSAGFETAEFYGAPVDVLLSNGSIVWAPVVAEHAVALLLGLWRDLPALERRRTGHVWDRASLMGKLRSADGARVGILGYGTIGREIALRLKPFGTHVIGIARQPKPCDAAERVIGLGEIAALLPELDALINAIPAGPRTLRIVDAGMLAALKPTAVLINIGRGSTVDEDALHAALANGRLAGAGLDVFATEPLPKDHPFWALENVILSPHVAGFGSPQAMQRLHELCRANIINFRDGRPLLNPVSLHPA